MSAHVTPNRKLIYMHQILQLYTERTLKSEASKTVAAGITKQVTRSEDTVNLTRVIICDIIILARHLLP